MLVDIASKFPPRACRMLARKGNGRNCRPKSYDEIAREVGVARSTLILILSRPDWGNTGIRTVDAIARACGVDFLNPKRHAKLVRRGKFAHIANANGSQRLMFDRILPKDMGSRQSSGPPKAI